MTIDLQQRLEDDRVVITATLQYRIGTTTINGRQVAAIDWLDGRGLQPITLRVKPADTE